jgi:hypothetical protein
MMEARPPTKKTGRLSCGIARLGEFYFSKEEALVGVEPTMADLQSAALATWLQRLNYASFPVVWN